MKCCSVTRSHHMQHACAHDDYAERPHQSAVLHPESTQVHTSLQAQETTQTLAALAVVTVSKRAL